MVTVEDPVAAALPLCKVETVGMLYEKALVTVPQESATEAENVNETPTPEGDWQIREESETQLVVSQPLEETVALGDDSNRPKLAPKRVTREEPVAAPLVRANEETIGTL